MQRARRLASTAVVAVLAVSGLSACRADPGVAAYVGSSSISEQTVQEHYTDAKTKLDAYIVALRAEQLKNPDPSQQPIPEVVELGLTPGNVLQALVGVQVLKRIAAERNVKAATADPAQLAQQLGLPPGTKYVAVFAEYQGYLNALLATAPPAVLSEGDKFEVYKRLSAANGPTDTMTFAQFTSELLTPERTQLLESAYGLRANLKTATKEADVRFNPRYSVQELPLLPVPTPQGGVVSLVSLPVNGDSAPAVTDLS